MPEPYRRNFNEDDYRRGGRRSGSDRFRDEARPWLRDEDSRWRQDEGRDDRSMWGGAERSWRDQADGDFERAPRWREHERASGYGPSSYERDRGALPREDGRESHEDGYRQPRGDGATYAGYRSGGPGYGRDGGGRGNGFAGRGPKGYHRSDERLTEDLSEQLMDDDDVDASEIVVEVRQGEVTLSGTVNDRRQKRRAEDIAEGVSGVSQVTNNLRLSRPEHGQDYSMPGRHTNGPGSSSSQASDSSQASKPTNRAI
jgi:hypothetical protein